MSLTSSQRLLRYTLLLFFPILIGCSRSEVFDKEKETAAILELHELQRDHHFLKDSIAFAHQLSDAFISVNRGVISRPERDETIARYHGYFSSVEFIRWEDVSEPIVRFSSCGDMAYTIVDKIVEVSYEDEEGQMVNGETHFAWTAIYNKYPDGWKIDCVTSTEKPDE